MEVGGDDSLIICIILEAQTALCAKPERMIGLGDGAFEESLVPAFA
jgi:hypothetical protein